MDMPTETGAPMGGSQMPPVAPAPMGGSTGSEDPKAKALGYIAQFEAWLEMYMVTKAPFQIPMGGKEFLATVAPYLAIVGIVLFVMSLPVLLGLGAMVGSIGMMGGQVGYGYAALVSLVSGVVAMALEAWAVPGLFKRTSASWRLVFYATLVSFAGSVLSLNLIGAVIGGVIGWYILFQVKVLYKN